MVADMGCERGRRVTLSSWKNEVSGGPGAPFGTSSLRDTSGIQGRIGANPSLGVRGGVFMGWVRCPQVEFQSFPRVLVAGHTSFPAPAGQPQAASRALVKDWQTSGRC